MLRRAALLSSGLTSAGVKNGVIQDDWDVINEIAKAGRASDFYSIGDKKSLSWGWQGVVDMILVGINADTKTSGGKANMTWMASSPLAKKAFFEATRSKNNNSAVFGVIEGTSYKDCSIAFYVEGLQILLPSEVQEGIVRVNKTYSTDWLGNYETGAYKVWIPSTREIQSTFSYDHYEQVYEKSGPIYSISPSDLTFPDKAKNFWSRSWSAGRADNGWSTNDAFYITITTDGKFQANQEQSTYNTKAILRYIFPCFCL